MSEEFLKAVGEAKKLRHKISKVRLWSCVDSISKHPLVIATQENQEFYFISII